MDILCKLNNYYIKNSTKISICTFINMQKRFKGGKGKITEVLTKSKSSLPPVVPPTQALANTTTSPNKANIPADTKTATTPSDTISDMKTNTFKWSTPVPPRENSTTKKGDPIQNPLQKFIDYDTNKYKNSKDLNGEGPVKKRFQNIYSAMKNPNEHFSYDISNSTTQNVSTSPKIIPENTLESTKSVLSETVNTTTVSPVVSNTIPTLPIVDNTMPRLPITHPVPNIVVADNTISSIVPKQGMDNVIKELKTISKPFENSNDNLKPEYIFKGNTNSNKPYESTLSQETTVNDITNENLIEEMRKRELVKNDDSNSAVKIKLKDGSTYMVGESKTNIKLTSLGVAYSNDLKKKDVNTAVFVPNETNNNKAIITPSGKTKSNYAIIVPPEPSEHCFIEDGKQKHLIIIFDETTGMYKGIGYLTSKKVGNVFAEKQYKDIENGQEHSGVMSNKKQYFVPFEQSVDIEAKDIKIVKYSDVYVETFTEHSREILEEALQKQGNRQVISFDKDGLTKEDCLNMCKEHDKVVVAKEKNPKGKLQHPLTPDQEQKNKFNKQEQLNKSAKNKNNTHVSKNKDIFN